MSVQKQLDEGRVDERAVGEVHDDFRWLKIDGVIDQRAEARHTVAVEPVNDPDFDHWNRVLRGVWLRRAHLLGLVRPAHDRRGGWRALLDSVTV